MKRITELTKRDIFDLLIHGYEDHDLIPSLSDEFKTYYKSEKTIYKLSYWGRLEELDFIKRLYDIDNIKSNDSRYDSFEHDYWQHTINNFDWDSYWIFEDERFGLLSGVDELFLKFICEIFHPIVRNDKQNWQGFLTKFNDLLKFDGYEIIESIKISGRASYTWKDISSENKIVLEQINNIKTNFNSEYVNKQVDLMYELINSAPDSAIGKAKELLEICCKTILEESNREFSSEASLINLTRMTCEQLGLSPNCIDENNKAKEVSSRILGNLANISQGMSELRNLYGDGHGKSRQFKALPSRYAHLAVGSAVTAVHFIWETYEDRKRNENNNLTLDNIK